MEVRCYDRGPMTPRLKPLALDQWTAEAKELIRGRFAVADKYLSGLPDAPPMPGILGLFGHHPSLTADWLAFSGGLIENPVVDPADRELLILRVGWRTQCRYAWAQHVGMAEKSGLTPLQIAAVAGTADAGVWSDRQSDMLTATDQMVADYRIDDTTWQRLVRHFDEQQLLEFLFVVGSYVCLALVLNAAGLEPDRDADGGWDALPGLEK
jgi:4-carboxymuconolactone decarboxylase